MKSENLALYAGTSLFLIVLWSIISIFTSLITSAIIVAVMCILFAIKYRYEGRGKRAYKRERKLQETTSRSMPNILANSGSTDDNQAETTMVVSTTTFERMPPVNEAYNGDVDYVVIDCESATSQQYICAISLVGILNNSIVYRKYWLIQPPDNKYSRMNSSIHGIKSIDTIDSPRFIDVYEELKSHLTYRDVVAHNYSSDRAMLNKTCAFYKLPRILIAHWCCTYRIYDKSLKDCASIHNIALDHHTAISDAEVCAKLFILHKKDNGDDWPKITVRKPLNSSGCVTVYRVTETVENENNFFYDKKIAVTGNFASVSFDELLERISSLGAAIRKTVTDNVDLVVLGSDPSSKVLAGIEKVQDQGVVISLINETEILKLLQVCEVKR